MDVEGGDGHRMGGSLRHRMGRLEREQVKQTHTLVVSKSLLTHLLKGKCLKNVFLPAELVRSQQAVAGRTERRLEAGVALVSLRRTRTGLIFSIA